MCVLNEVIFKIESTENLALTDVIMYFEAINFGLVKTKQKLIKSNKTEENLQPIVESISEGSILLKLLVPLVKEISKELLVSKIAEYIRKNGKDLIYFEVLGDTVIIRFINKLEVKINCKIL